MKSLGARDIDTTSTIIINFFLTLFLTLIFFYIFEFIMLNFVNKVLIKGIIKIGSGVHVLKALDLLFPRKIFFILANISIAFAFLIFLIILFIKIRKLKPINIIKAKE